MPDRGVRLLAYLLILSLAFTVALGAMPRNTNRWRDSRVACHGRLRMRCSRLAACYSASRSV